MMKLTLCFFSLGFLSPDDFFFEADLLPPCFLDDDITF
jgi:hypothetical protein